MLEVRGFEKRAVEDIFDEGQVGRESCYADSTMIFKAETQDELIKELMEFVAVTNAENVGIYEEQTGRVEICLVETDDSVPATEAEIERWKRKELRLWDVYYSFWIEEVERTPYKVETEGKGYSII